MSELLWEPSAARKAETNVTRFIKFVNQRHGRSIASYDELHAYSVDEQEGFWCDICEFGEVKAETRGDREKQSCGRRSHSSSRRASRTSR